jgi:hypothetical protein
MSNGSVNGNKPTNMLNGDSAVPKIRSYEEDRNATSEDVYVFSLRSSLIELATDIYTDHLVPTPHRMVYPFPIPTRSSERVLMVPSSFRTFT